MTKRNLYNSLSEYKKSKNDDYLMNVLSSCDGKTDLKLFAISIILVN